MTSKRKVNMKKIAILYSGGLDSFMMYHYAKKTYPDAEVKCVFYAHGQDSEADEIKSLPDFVSVRKIDWLGDEIKPVSKKSDPFAGNIYIPGRNMVFVTLAASQELPDEVWMGTMWDEDNIQATDKNEHFRSEISSLISYVLHPFLDGVKVKFPFVELEFTKEKLVKWALENGILQDQLKSTVSCWHQHGGIPCGVCKQCQKRFLVFGLNGFEEEYSIHPTKSPEAQDNMLAYLSCKTPNRDERVVIDMIVRYFTNHYTLDSSDEWEAQMIEAINARA